jgi:hypothetical protein
MRRLPALFTNTASRPKFAMAGGDHGTLPVSKSATSEASHV